MYRLDIGQAKPNHISIYDEENEKLHLLIFF